MFFFKGKFQSSHLKSVFFWRERMNTCIMFSNSKIIIWIIEISKLTKNNRDYDLWSFHNPAALLQPCQAVDGTLPLHQNCTGNANWLKTIWLYYNNHGGASGALHTAVPRCVVMFLTRYFENPIKSRYTQPPARAGTHWDNRRPHIAHMSQAS